MAAIMDRIATSAPLNKTASQVTGKGVHWKAPVHLSPGQVLSDVPLPTYPIDDRWGTSPQPGERFGRFVVRGYGGKGSTAAKWVVRCDCGNYCHRTAKALRTPKEASRLMCSECDKLEEIKAGLHPDPHGAKP